MPTEMRALQDFDEPEKLQINVNDVLTIIEGRSVCVCVCMFVRLCACVYTYTHPPQPFLSLRAEHYWWRGQDSRTLLVGQFPRHVVTSVAGLSARDISRPLKHSFIHTGHGDTDPHRSWGHADRIDR